jgi:hypothetical protein
MLYRRNCKKSLQVGYTKKENKMSREKTSTECRDEFLDQIRGAIRHWRRTEYSADVKAVQPDETTYRMEGLAHSILAMIDGEGQVPAFILAPIPHPSDKAFRQNEDEDWWPENHVSKVKCDISGDLHNNFYQRKNCAPIA